MPGGFSYCAPGGVVLVAHTDSVSLPETNSVSSWKQKPSAARISFFFRAVR